MEAAAVPFGIPKLLSVLNHLYAPVKSNSSATSASKIKTQAKLSGTFLILFNILLFPIYLDTEGQEYYAKPDEQRLKKHCFIIREMTS